MSASKTEKPMPEKEKMSNKEELTDEVLGKVAGINRQKFGHLII